jgi:hypothetical protein
MASFTGSNRDPIAVHPGTVIAAGGRITNARRDVAAP